uniref:Helicase C-terminal domain-containing protein n=1 Tax=Cladonia uncialis subsp. uncialis TaxID=180999 RepID=A0A2K9YDT8_CLAUC|nr:hypothetical protein [Cladonia uncialis subsp. uncialis]
MSRITFLTLPAFDNTSAQCNYNDSSQKNPFLKGINQIRESIGLGDKNKWSETWRPIFINFIRTSGILEIPLAGDNKAGNKNNFLTKVNEFITLDRDDDSNVPDPFLETALFEILKDVRNQVIALDKNRQVKQEREKSAQLTSHPPYTPVPTSTPGPAAISDNRAVLVTGRTPISLRRANKNGLIGVKLAFWSHLAVFPPSVPPHDQLPELVDWKLGVVHQLLKSHALWNDNEPIHWLDPAGSPFELATDLDLRQMVFAAQDSQNTVIAREILIRGSDNEQVRFPWSSDPSDQVLVRNTVDVQPSVNLKRPSGVGLGGGDGVDLNDLSSKHKRSRHSGLAGAPSTTSEHSSILTHRSKKLIEPPVTGANDRGNAKEPIVIDDLLAKSPPHSSQPIDSEHSPEELDEDTRALFDGPAFDPNNIAAAARHAIETEACAQMGKNNINWDKACELVKADKTCTGPDDTVYVQGLAFPMKKHQVIAAYWMLLTESLGCSGGMESDEMGYGKANHDIRRFRNGGEANPHLPKSTLESPQAPDALCPSHGLYPIQCPCQEGSVASSLKPKYGVNLAILPVALIQTWLREFRKMFEKQPRSRFLMTIKIAWGAAEKSPHLKHWALTDEYKQRLLVNNDWLVEAYHSSIFILTSQHPMTLSKLKIEKAWEWQQLDPKTPKNPANWVISYEAVCFGSIYVDEAHRLRNATNPVMEFLREVNTWFMREPTQGESPKSVPPRRERYVPVKWFVTGTPWERSPEDFASALQTIKSAAWLDPKNPYHTLRHENIVQLAKAHEAYLKKAITEEVDADNSDAIRIIKEIRRIVQLSMIRRTDDSYIHGLKSSSSRDARKQVSKEERENYVKAMAKWRTANMNKPENKRSEQPAAPLDTNRKQAPSLRLRILADFPGLIDLLCDNDNQPLPSAFTIDDLRDRNADYKRASSNILASSPKYQAVLQLVKGTWPASPDKEASLMKSTDKLVVITSFPVCAWLIARGLSKAGFKAKLIDSTMNPEKRDYWQDLFQEDPDIIPNLTKQNPDDEPPRILVATTALCGLGLTLHKAHHLVKFDVDFLDGGDRQAVKRIYRIGQKYKSFVWRFITTDNTEECMVRRRQELRAGFVKEAFKLPPNEYGVNGKDLDHGPVDRDNHDFV